MRAAIYARVSSAAQRDAHTIESQLHMLRPFVERQGWTLVDTYLDDGRSAKTGQLDKREGFARLLRDLERFDVVVIADVDRLTRTDSIEERAQILGPFQRAGVRIVSPSSEIDLRTMFGQIDVTLRSLYAAEENRKRRERIMSGKDRAIAEGRKPAGPTPFGLSYARATGAWSLNAERAAIVREIYKRVIAGESCMVIGDDLHHRGAPSPRGPWTRHKVWQIARSRHTTGEWIADKKRRLAMPVPAIVDEATWSAAQSKLIEHGKRGLRKTRHVYLLEGLAVCGVCGSPMAIRSATRIPRRGHTSPAAYVCRARKLARTGEPRCTAPILTVADVDARVWATVSAALASPGLAARLTARSASLAAERRDWKADADGHKAHLARLDRHEAGLLGRHQRGLVSDSGLDSALADLLRTRAAVRVQLGLAERAAAERDTEAEVSPEAWLSALRQLASDGTPAARRSVVAAVVEPGAVVDGNDVRLTLRIAAPGSSRGGSSNQHRDTKKMRKPVRLRVVA